MREKKKQNVYLRLLDKEEKSMKTKHAEERKALTTKRTKAESKYEQFINPAKRNDKARKYSMWNQEQEIFIHLNYKNLEHFIYWFIPGTDIASNK